MINCFRHGLALPAIFAALSVPTVSAHHSHNNFNRSDIHVWSGVISQYKWAMPHVFFRARTATAEGELVEYTVELLHPPAMAETGWSADTLHVGDRITWEGAADFNPDRHFASMIWIELPDGTRMSSAIENTGQAVVPSTDFSGLWRRSSSFGSTYAPPAGIPLNATGQALYDNFDPGTNPQLDCQEPGPPRSTIVPYPIAISWLDSEHLLLEQELRPEPRLIHLDDEHQAGEASPWGFSRGHFEGDELVVETDNFVADRWGIHAGIDSSAQKQLTERFSLEDDGLTLHIQMSVEDPVYLASAYLIDYRMDKIPDRALVDVPCSLEGARLFLTGYNNE